MAAKKSIESPWWYKQEPQKFMSSADVSLMSAEEVGCYFLLLQHAWLGGQDCSLPNEPERLARLARVPKVSDIVMSKFVVNKAGRLVNPRLSKEWADAVQRSKAGKQASEKRWNKPSESNAGAYAGALPPQSEANATRQDNTTPENKSVSLSQSVSPSVFSAPVSTPTPTPLPGAGAQHTAAGIGTDSGQLAAAAERLATKLASILGSKPPVGWTDGVQTLIAQFGETELSAALSHACCNPYWLENDFMKDIRKVSRSIETIIQQYRDDTKPKRKKDGRKRGDSRTGKMKWSPSVRPDPANPTTLKPSIA